MTKASKPKRSCACVSGSGHLVAMVPSAHAGCLRFNPLLISALQTRMLQAERGFCVLQPGHNTPLVLLMQWQACVFGPSSRPDGLPMENLFAGSEQLLK